MFLGISFVQNLFGRHSELNSSTKESTTSHTELNKKSTKALMPCNFTTKDNYTKNCTKEDLLEWFEYSTVPSDITASFEESDEDAEEAEEGEGELENSITGSILINPQFVGVLSEDAVGPTDVMDILNIFGHINNFLIRRKRSQEGDSVRATLEPHPTTQNSCESNETKQKIDIFQQPITPNSTSERLLLENTEKVNDKQKETNFVDKTKSVEDDKYGKKDHADNKQFDENKFISSTTSKSESNKMQSGNEEEKTLPGSTKSTSVQSNINTTERTTSSTFHLRADYKKNESNASLPVSDDKQSFDVIFREPHGKQFNSSITSKSTSKLSVIETKTTIAGNNRHIGTTLTTEFSTTVKWNDPLLQDDSENYTPTDKVSDTVTVQNMQRGTEEAQTNIVGSKYEGISTLGYSVVSNTNGAAGYGRITSKDMVSSPNLSTSTTETVTSEVVSSESENEVIVAETSSSIYLKTTTTMGTPLLIKNFQTEQTQSAKDQITTSNKSSTEIPGTSKEHNLTHKEHSVKTNNLKAIETQSNYTEDHYEEKVPLTPAATNQSNEITAASNKDNTVTQYASSTVLPSSTDDRTQYGEPTVSEEQNSSIPLENFRQRNNWEHSKKYTSASTVSVENKETLSGRVSTIVPITVEHTRMRIGKDQTRDSGVRKTSDEGFNITQNTSYEKMTSVTVGSRTKEEKPVTAEKFLSTQSENITNWGYSEEYTTASTIEEYEVIGEAQSTVASSTIHSSSTATVTIPNANAKEHTPLHSIQEHHPAHSAPQRTNQAKSSDKSKSEAILPSTVVTTKHVGANHATTTGAGETTQEISTRIVNTYSSNDKHITMPAMSAIKEKTTQMISDLPTKSTKGLFTNINTTQKSKMDEIVGKSRLNSESQRKQNIQATFTEEVQSSQVKESQYPCILPWGYPMMPQYYPSFPYYPSPQNDELKVVNMPFPKQKSQIVILNPPVVNYDLPYMTPPQAFPQLGSIYTGLPQANPLQAMNPKGQYYMCNAIPAPTSHITSMSGVEVRNMLDRFRITDSANKQRYVISNC